MKNPEVNPGRALICGSMAFDTIMVFQDHFRNHILPDKLHMLNVSFLALQMRRELLGPDDPNLIPAVLNVGAIEALSGRHEAALPGVFDLDAAFAPWIIGDETYERLLGVNWKDSKRPMLERLGFTKYERKGDGYMERVAGKQGPRELRAD